MSQIIGNGFIPNDGMNGTAAPWTAPNAGAYGPFPTGSPGYAGYAPASSDAVRPAWYGGGGDGPYGGGSGDAPGASNALSGGGIAGILAQLSSMVQQYIGSLSSALTGTSGTGTPGTAANGTTANNAATFQNVSLGSTGDPHLSVHGTEQNPDGTVSNVNSKFDSMTGHNDLFSTHDFGDGFRVSTTVTQPAANGVTQNASATASMDGGRESVSMTNTGAISVSDHGQAVALAPGQSITLSGGEQVAEAANGSVSITENGNGKSLTTTFTQNGGGGVDVTAQGQGVTLEGDLITGGTTPVANTTAPAPHRLSYV